MDRDLQRAILLKMRDVYPECIYGFPEENSQFSADAFREIHYLTEHGLCETRFGSTNAGKYMVSPPRLTARGLDFLEDDGGLTAILGVVTVKLHVETLRSLLEARVEKSDLPPEKKSALKALIGKLSGAALQAGSTDLVKMGLEHSPDVIQWLMRLTGL